jgi:hypothetical protein
MDTEYIYHVHPHSPFPCAYPPPLIPILRKYLFFCLSFFLISCMVQVGFTLVLYISCFNQITPLLLLLILYHHVTLIFLSLLYIHIYMGSFNDFHSLTFISLSSHSPLRWIH